LQTNKVKFCRDFKLIHSIDSLRLLEELAKRGETWGFVPPVLLEVNVAREPQKNGLEPEEVAATLKAARDLGLNVTGLMTIAPYGKLDVARQSFKELKLLRDNLGLEHLSMGMSEDYPIAIEEGATMIRPGRVLFE
jgi:PLP dependent protein